MQDACALGCMNKEDAALTPAALMASLHSSTYDDHEHKSSYSESLTESELKECHLQPNDAPIGQRSLSTASASEQTREFGNCMMDDDDDDDDTHGLWSSKVSDFPNCNTKELLGCRGASCTSSTENTTTVMENQVVNDVQEPLLETSGRERLKRHRVEVAGRVWIPDTWGQEDLLKDWIDCTTFDSSLPRQGIMSARAALVEEGRRTKMGGLGVHDRF